MHNIKNLEFWYNYTIKIKDYISSLKTEKKTKISYPKNMPSDNNNHKNYASTNISQYNNEKEVVNRNNKKHPTKGNDIEWL